MNNTLQNLAKDYLGLRFDESAASENNGQHTSGPITNVGQTERLISAGIGALMVAGGLSRRGVSGLVTAGAGAALLYRSYSGHCGLYQKLGLTSTDAASPTQYHEQGIHIEESVTIARPASELYAYWRQLDKLPTFMNHLESVTVQDDRRSHWVAKAPAGLSVQWDAEIINDIPNETIAWRSLEGASVHNAGSVRFVEAAGGSTEVRVVLDYIPPAGTVGKWVARLFGEAPDQQIADDLQRFKSLMETDDAARASESVNASGSNSHAST